MKKDKKGVELSLNVVIISILVILVLFVLILFFTGGAGNAITRIKNLFQSQTLDLSQAVVKCNTYCANFESTGQARHKDLYCQAAFKIDDNGDGKVDRSDVNCPQVGSSCSSISADDC